MTDEPLNLGRPLIYQALVLVVVLLWGFHAGDRAQYLLLVYQQNPHDWYGFSLILVVTLALASALLSWFFRSRIAIGSTDWDYRERELSFSDFCKLVEQYRQAYSSVLVDLDTNLLFTFIFFGAASVLAPPALAGVSVLGLVYSPYVYAAFLIGFGVSFALFVFRASPSPASSEFQTASIKDIEPYVKILANACGISWVGVRLTIGEWQGLYTIRNVGAIGRVESIESAGRIIIEPKLGSPTTALTREVELGSDLHSKVLHHDAKSSELKQHVERFVLDALEFYAATREVDSLIYEVMQDVKRCLARPDPSHPNDALISEDTDRTVQTRGKDDERIRDY